MHDLLCIAHMNAVGVVQRKHVHFCTHEVLYILLATCFVRYKYLCGGSHERQEGTRPWSRDEI